MSTSENKNQSSIDRLNRGLYSRTESHDTTKREPRLSHHDYNVHSEWEEGEEGSHDSEASSGKKSVSHKILFISIAFCVVAVGVAGYLFFAGFNMFSSANIDVVVTGPNNIDGGDELIFDVSVANNNPSLLKDVVLNIEYPQGAHSVSDLNTELTRHRESLGDISEGSDETRRFRAVLFGEVNTTRPIRVEIEYGVEGSSSRFTKEEVYEVFIRSAPVVLSLSHPQEINPVQDVEMELVVASNSNQTLRDLVIHADYPFGFTFSDSSPAPSYEDNVWKIGNLDPNEEKVISISGRMVGQVNEDKTFRFNAGMEDVNNPNTVGVSFISEVQSIRVGEVFMELGLSLGGSQDPEYISELGRTVNARISWNNNVGSNVNDVEIRARLRGDIFDRSSVRTNNGGFYRSVDDTITWDRNVLSDLSQVTPNESGNVSFNFRLLDSSSIDVNYVLDNLDMFIDVEIAGTKVSDLSSPERLSSIASGKIKVATGARLNSRLVYSSGPFQNTGPIPPRVDQETTYTVIWNASSTLNDMSGVRVETTLPPYVEWSEEVYPSGENIFYNSLDRKVVWEVGEVSADMGTFSTPREVAFQVTLTPSANQINSSPVVINQSTLIGTDTFTGISLEDSRSSLTTRITTDPLYSSNQYGRVGQ